MPLNPQEQVQRASELMEQRSSAQRRLELILEYREDGQPKDSPLSARRLAGLPAGVPDEVKRLAEIARVNLLRYVVSARVQAMFVDGLQTPAAPDNVAAWDIWQANRFDARQIGVHRAALTFGAGYVVVLPGDPVPVMRGVSPRKLTALYADGADWPEYALWKRGGRQWRLLDAEAVYPMRGDDGDTLEPDGELQLHDARVTPVVKFRETDDLDVDVKGVVEPFMLLQDQINITSFGLLVAQHYGAFRQRYILGWIAETEEQALKTGASRLMMFEDPPDDVSVGEFAQTDLRGYIESREASIRHLATVSQTPVHELLGQVVNLSAEALEAMRASHQAAIDEHRAVIGESWEQALNLAGELAGEPPDATASVVWRDTRVRSLSDAAAALGDLTQRLGVPPRALWTRIPGVAQHELARWEAMAEEGDAFADLERLLDRQANGGAGG